MIMTKENRIVEKKDLITSGEYTEKRKELRKKLLEYKKNRRVAIGPYATFYFESFETMIGQIQEMLYIEKGGNEQLKDELNAYNPLIPKGKELIATLMFEIDDAILRSDFLSKVGGIEKKVSMHIDGDKIKAVPDTNIENIRVKLDLLNSNLETEKQRKWKLELDIEENTGKIDRLKILGLIDLNLL